MLIRFRKAEVRMQFARALKFYFNDSHWFRKVLSVAACLLIPILGVAAATGWALEISRRVIRNQTDAVPAMDLRRSWTEGLAVWAIGLVYLLPVMALLGAGGLLSALIFPAAKSSAPMAFDSYWWGIEFITVALLLAAVLGMIAALGRFADTGSFRAAFQWREVISILRSAPVAFLQVVLAWLPLGLLALSGIAVCGVGLFFTTACALGSGFHLMGQAHRLAAEKAASGSVPVRA
jgi:ABC-type amino acid transport system permease subunit